MKKLTISDHEGDKSVTLMIDKKAEKALFKLLFDFDRETRVPRDLFRLMIMMENLSAFAHETFEMEGRSPLYIPDDISASLYTLLDIFDFFNHLKFSA